MFKVVRVLFKEQSPCLSLPSVVISALKARNPQKENQTMWIIISKMLGSEAEKNVDNFYKDGKTAAMMMMMELCVCISCLL